MLPFYNQFIFKYAIKNHLYLLNPKVNKQDIVILPKDAVLHYLDLTNDSLFPTRELPYLKDLPNNKKIPIYHIEDLILKEGTTSLLNKYLSQDIRKWNIKNIKHFRNVNLLELPNTDVNLISIFNYNTIKDLYRYSTSMLAEHNKYYNLMFTYFSYVKKSIDASPVSKHFIRINLPTLIPSYFIIDKIIEFNIVKYSRVIKDYKLKQIIDIYTWLSNKTRDKSSLKTILDEDCDKVVIEFYYKGYNCFLPLNVLRSLNDECSLESNVKVNSSKLHRLFIMFLLKFQNQVDSLIEGETIEPIESEENTVEKDLEAETQEEIDDTSDVDESNERTDTDIEINSLLVKKDKPKVNKEFKDIDVNKLSDFNDNTNIDSLFSDMIENKLVDIDNSEADNIYIDVTHEQEVDKENENLVLNYTDEHKESILKDKSVEDKFNLYITELVELKLATSAEIRALKKQFSNRMELKSPYNSTKHLDVDKVITKEQLTFTKDDKDITVNNILVSEDMKKEHLRSFDDKYIKNVIKKDILACVTNLEKANIIIKDYEIEEKSDALGNYEIHRLSLSPLSGKDSVVYFKLPKIDSEGELIASGVKYRVRKQKQDLPIRKISHNKVVLTSNYCKLFIARSERKAFDNYEYIVSHIKDSYLNEEGIITSLVPGNYFNNYLELPNIYSYMSKYFLNFETSEYKFLFNYSKIETFIDKEINKKLLSKKLVFIGYNNKKEIIVTDYDDELFIYKNDDLTSVGTIEDIINIDKTKIPSSFSTIKILGKDIPLGIAMAYYLGLSNLLSITKTEVKQIESNKQYKPEQGEVILKFNDYKLIFNKKNKESTLLLSGFLFFKDFIKKYNVKDFDNKSIFLLLIEERDFNILHIKELDLLKDLFLDPITISVLEEMNEPTDYYKLILRANQLLTNFSYPDINDSQYSRIRGYDRIPGLMYKVLVESVRNHKFKFNNKGKIELDPYKVWNTILQDNTVKIAEDINPITDIKEMEAVTLVGLDGLSREAIPTKLRKFSKQDMGLMSEATVDSSDVAVNTYLTPYAKLKNIRGLVDTEDKTYKDNNSKLFSTSAMLAPMIEYDD